MTLPGDAAKEENLINPKYGYAARLLKFVIVFIPSYNRCIKNCFRMKRNPRGGRVWKVLPPYACVELAVGLMFSTRKLHISSEKPIIKLYKFIT